MRLLALCDLKSRLVGYVSDEYYAVVPDVLLGGEDGSRVAARSTASGTIVADIPPGDSEFA